MTEVTPAVGAVAPSVEPYAPQGRAWGVLLLGRATFRALWIFAPLLMAVEWSDAEVGATVAAMGSFGWFALALASTEKTLLKYVPRMPRLTPALARQTLLVSAVPTAIAVAVASLADQDRALIFWGLAWAATGGSLQVVASLHRLARKTTWDTLLFVAAATWMLVTSGLSIALHASPIAWFAGCVTGLIAIQILSLAWLPPRWRRATPTRSTHRLLRRPLLRSLVLLGLPEVLSLTSVSAGFWAISAVGQPRDAIRYYVAVMGAGIVGSLVAYVVRLLQPDVSLRMRGDGIEVGRRRALRLVTYAVASGLSCLAVVALAIVLDSSWWLILTLLTVGEIAVFALRTVAANLVENGRRAWLAGNSAASATGLGVAVVLLFTTVSSGGASAAMAALVVAQICNAALLGALLLTRGPVREATT